MFLKNFPHRSKALPGGCACAGLCLALALAITPALLCGCATQNTLTIDLSGAADSPALDTMLAPLLPTGYRVHSIYRPAASPGRDQPPMLAAVLAPRDETLPQARPRILAILKHQGGSTYTLQAKSSTALLPYGHDPFFPDCLSDIYIKDNTITIIHYGGGKTRWGRSDTFSFDPQRQGWYLADILVEYSDTQDPDLEIPPLHLGPRDFGTMAFQDWDIGSVEWQKTTPGANQD